MRGEEVQTEEVHSELQAKIDRLTVLCNTLREEQLLLHSQLSNESVIVNEMHKSRSRLYSNTSIRRFIVPPCLSSWNSSFEDYHPVEFTKEEFLDRKLAPYADTESADSITFNSWDSELEIDRRSYCKRNTQFYSIVDGVPRNPIGRTGVKVGRLKK